MVQEEGMDAVTPTGPPAWNLDRPELVWFDVWMKTWTITESKAQLSALVEQVVTTGRPVVIGRGGKAMVQLVPYGTAHGKNRRLGAFRGQIKMAEDFNSWGEEESRAFGMKE